MVSRLRRGVGARLAFQRRDHADRPGFDAHAAWSAGGWPSVAGAFTSVARGPFYSHAVSVDLGGILLQFASGSARTLNRGIGRVREDGNTSLVIGINHDGEIVGEAGRKPLLVLPMHVLMLDLSQTSRLAIPASRSTQLAVPRALAERYLGPVHRLHGRIIAPEPAALFAAHLHQLETAIPTLLVAQAKRLAGVLLDLLTIATRRDDAPNAGGVAVGRRSAASLRAAVDASIAQPALTMAVLCQRLGVSRSTLSRAFAADGGVEAHIRNLRLDKVREALLDPANSETISALADRWGFSDPSHLTRAFRARFGMTPGAMRADAGWK